MRKLQLTKSISISVIKNKMANAQNSAEYKRWQVLYLVSSYAVDANYLADITGYSKANIYAIVQQHNNVNKSDVSIKQRGGRRRSLLTIEQEQIFMKGLEDKAIKGQILSYLDIKKMVEKEVGKPVSDDFIWDLFKRNNWTKHSPRPHHPKKNAVEQEEFKKNSRTIWLPQKMILQPN
jgi:transposase